MASPKDELERIQAAYRKRDAAAPQSWPWASRGYRLRMQQLEWMLMEQLVAAGTSLTGLRVLEVGCGSGYFLSRFLDYGAGTATGIDLMESRIAVARNRDPRLELLCGDASELPWADSSFDLVTQFTCFSSVLDRELRGRIAADMWRVLRPGGTVVSYDMRSTPGAIRWLRRAAGFRRPAVVKEGTPTAPVEFSELRRFFPDAALDARSLTLATDIAALAERSVVVARGLQLLPFLNTHLLVVGRKPTLDQEPLADQRRFASTTSR
jgi:SAM-dependent methyltransferase